MENSNMAGQQFSNPNKEARSRIESGYAAMAGDASTTRQRELDSNPHRTPMMEAGLSAPLTDATRLIEADRRHRSLAADQALMLQMVMPVFRVSLKQLQSGITSWMQHQGFWVCDNKGEKIALMHSELSEMLEAVRKEDRYNEVEELADTVIRILDYAGYHEMDLATAIHNKMLKNYERPFMHGKRF